MVICDFDTISQVEAENNIAILTQENTRLNRRFEKMKVMDSFPSLWTIDQTAVTATTGHTSDSIQPPYETAVPAVSTSTTSQSQARSKNSSMSMHTHHQSMHPVTPSPTAPAPVKRISTYSRKSRQGTRTVLQGALIREVNQFDYYYATETKTWSL